jgi:hypothetical protein
MNTNSEVPHQAEDLNPIQQVGHEELINCLTHFLNSITAARNLHQVPCPKLAGISQSISNVGLQSDRKILGFIENGIVIQVTDILLQPFPHEVKAGEQDFQVMKWRIHKKPLVFAPFWVCEEIRE